MLVQVNAQVYLEHADMSKKKTERLFLLCFIDIIAMCNLCEKNSYFNLYVKTRISETGVQTCKKDIKEAVYQKRFVHLSCLFSFIC